MSQQAAGIRALHLSASTLERWPGSLPEPVVMRVEGSDGINELFEYYVVLQTETPESSAQPASRDDVTALLGGEMTVLIETDGFIEGHSDDSDDRDGDYTRNGHRPVAVTREITGVVMRIARHRNVRRGARFEIILRPWLHLAAFSTDCRVFQNLSVVDITREVLDGYSFITEWRLSGQYPARDIQTQLNETDADFLMRLWQEWGINFHFEHEGGNQRLVMSDSNDAFRQNTGKAYERLRFHDGDNQIDGDYVRHFDVAHAVVTTRYGTRDHDYTRPLAPMKAEAHDFTHRVAPPLDVFLWRADGGSDYSQPNAGNMPDANDTDEQGLTMARTRLDALGQHAIHIRAGGPLRGMGAGRVFTLFDHPDPQTDGEYVAIKTHLLIEDIGDASVTGASSGWRVNLQFEARPFAVRLKPDVKLPKPRWQGPETAVVVGPEAADSPPDIHTDYLGRIKVRFRWDRYGRGDHTSSCWVRVSSAWAGNQLGAAHLPRIGQVVIVSFIGGDPDLPIVTGRVHNEYNLPAWQLPAQQALSGFRSRELGPRAGNAAAGRSNHLLLDDTEGKMQAQLKSDHAHSSLSLGPVTRVEDHAGRKDERGEGFELRSDSHGVLRAGAGLLVSTDRRERARAHMTDMAETVARLGNAQRLQEQLAGDAVHHEAQDDTLDQREVSSRLARQNNEVGGDISTGNSSTGVAARPAGLCAELTAPHLVLSSAAGMAAVAQGDVQVAAGGHAAITSTGHTSFSAGASLLASALGAVRLFARKGGMRLFAAAGAVQVQAQDDRIELIAKRALELISTTDWISLKASKGLSLAVGPTSLHVTGDGFRFHTRGVHHVWAAGHQTFGPGSHENALPPLPESVCLACLLKAARAGSPFNRF